MRDYGTKDGWHPDEKSSKAEADYRDGTAEEHCAVCTMFRPPNSCTAVKGMIREDGVCDYFKHK